MDFKIIQSIFIILFILHLDRRLIEAQQQVPTTAQLSTTAPSTTTTSTNFGNITDSTFDATTDTTTGATIGTTTTTTTTTTPPPPTPSSISIPSTAVQIPSTAAATITFTATAATTQQPGTFETSRRPNDGQPTASTVQFLKPKSKFKCLLPSDCLNGGLCHNGSCFCSPGFTGESCAINIDECRQVENPCMNNGVCIDDVASFRCDCKPGYRGEYCQDDNDMCLGTPCLNNAKCINHRTDYSCECEPGWEGKHCEHNIDDCSKNPCQNNGTCHDLINDYRCDCGSSGYTGKNCEVDFDDCAAKPCQNNGTCYDLINDYRCDCGSSGYTGKNCEVDIDDCATSPCGFGAKQCIDLTGDFKCVCHDGFTGKECDEDINECQTFALCMNGGTCENLHGGHRCNCKEGFRGDKCQEISDFCKAKQPCMTGTCKNVNPAQGTYHCECPSSHIGKRCDRKRDCFNECHLPHSQCINNVTCACLPGRREERIMCEYVSSCEQVEGDLCLNGGSCKNLETGGYFCACQEPFYGPICQFMIEKPQFDLILLIVVTCVGFLVAACAVVSLVIFRSVRKARATRGTYSPSTQEKFGNSASDLLKPPIPERLI